MEFVFLDPAVLVDQQLALHLLATEPAEVSIWKAPAYRFDIQRVATGERVGKINLRIGDTRLLTHYAGHIGYTIDQPHRGHGYAERACRLLLPLAARHGMQTIWITCSPDNLASRRTLQHLGAELIEIVPVPDDYPLPPGAIRQKCRYQINPITAKIRRFQPAGAASAALSRVGSTSRFSIPGPAHKSAPPRTRS